MLSEKITRQIILWAAIFALGVLSTMAVSYDQRLAQEEIFKQTALDVSKDWATISVAKIDPVSLGLEENSVLALRLESQREVPIKLQNATETTLLREREIKSIDYSAFYRADGTPLDYQELVLSPNLQNVFNQAIATESTKTLHLEQMNNISKQSLMVVFVPITANNSVVGAYRVDVKRLAVNPAFDRIVSDIAYWGIALFCTVLFVVGLFLSAGILRNQRVQAKLKFMASHDGLTGLYNRHEVSNKLRHDLKIRSEGEIVAATILNVSKFKEVNDLLGHVSADMVLKRIGEMISSVLGNHGFASRISADEFTIGFRGPAILKEQFSRKIERILELCSQPFEIDGQFFNLKVDAGMATAPNDGTNLKDLLKAADLALQTAKKCSDSSLRHFNQSMLARLQRRRKLEKDMRAGLQNNQFCLHYQPQLDLKTGKYIGFEALVRWDHPVDGLISPGEFIPLAEETGLIKKLGAWVVDQACRDAHSIDPELTIAVNISAAQFQLDDVAKMIERTIMRYNLPPHRLEVEVTESVFVNNKDYVAKQLNKIAELGIGVAIDDFGTGYSSLTYLAEFPFTKIKIDRSFVIKMEDHQQTGAIVSTIIALSESLGAKTIAEGVETENQAILLRAAGCQSVQGFLYGRPEPLNESNDNHNMNKRAMA